MNIKEQIAEQIREYISDGSERVIIDNDNFELDLNFTIDKVTTYEEENYGEYELVGVFHLEGSYITVKGATLSDADTLEIIKLATVNTDIIW